MFKLPVANWIANAAARFTGTHGVVTQHAESVDCSRQTVYEHAAKVQAAVEAEHSGGPTRAQLLQTIEELRQENAQLWDTLNHSVEVPPVKQQEFTATATAMGIIVLRQFPSGPQLVGLALVVAGVALHRAERARS